MSFSVTASARKARRKEERERKKENKRSKHQGKKDSSKKDNSSKKEAAKHESSKRKKAPTKLERSPGKKARRDPLTPQGPYANLPPEVAAAMRRDDDEIADLEVKLGLSNNGAKDRNRLNNEYAKKECFGEDFGSFLDGLDTMVKRIIQPNAAAENPGGADEDSSSEDDDDSSSSSDDESSSDSDHVEKECTE